MKATKDCSREERMERILLLLDATLLMQMDEKSDHLYRLAHMAHGRCCEFDKDRFFGEVDKLIRIYKEQNLIDIEKVMSQPARF